MKKLCIIALFFLAACANKSNQPVTLLPVNTMKITVWQLMQVDEYLTRQIQVDTTVQPQIERAKYYQQVFNLNKVDRTQFYATMDYLERHPVEYKILMDSVEALSKREKIEQLKH